jgi:Domain of unknown function DUF29
MRKIVWSLRALQRQADARMDCAGFAMQATEYAQDFYRCTPEQAQMLRQLWRLMKAGNRVNAWNDLTDRPNLKPQPGDTIASGHRSAVIDANTETRLSPKTSPSSSPLSFDQVISSGS